MGVTRRNELRKHIASWLNTLGALILSVGSFTPTVALLLGIQSSATRDVIVIVIATSLLSGIAFHLLGRLVLSGYEE
ncbi:MAG TPA: hypothetical protein VGC77_03365 [Rhodopseudomonas sp.]|uniref:hypothetical protein n=1 Tax=Rhodopseudomonas sp. TaxID=1078 RepID=UPI002EDAAC32